MASGKRKPANQKNTKLSVKVHWRKTQQQQRKPRRKKVREKRPPYYTATRGRKDTKNRGMYSSHKTARGSEKNIIMHIESRTNKTDKNCMKALNEWCATAAAGASQEKPTRIGWERTKKKQVWTQQPYNWNASKHKHITAAAAVAAAQEPPPPAVQARRWGTVFGVQCWVFLLS